MASTGAREASRKPGEMQSYKMGIVKLNKGTLVFLRVADGYVYAARTTGSITDLFVGVANETVDNSGGSAGGKSINVLKTGSYVFLKTSAVQTDLGTVVYAADDQTVTPTSTNAVKVGFPTELIDGTSLRVRIDALVQ
jgi:hypothetical protein